MNAFVIQNFVSESRFWMKRDPKSFWGGSLGGLGRFLGCLWGLGGVLEALGGSPDRFLKDLGATLKKVRLDH